MMLRRISRAKALDLLHHCLEEGEVQWGPHFKKALADESLSILEVYGILRGGNIYEEPEQDIKTADWKYRVEGYEPSGKWLAIILTFREVDRVFLITCFSIEARRRR